MKNNLTLFAREGKAKSLQNTGGGTSRHEALIIAEQFSQCQTSRSEGAQQSAAQHDSARFFNYFNTQMARFLWSKKGEATVSKSSCSWAQGRATSAEQPTNHALITHLSPTQTVSLARIWKYVACLLLVLFVGVGNVWGADFSATEISTSGTTKNHVTCTSTAGSASNKQGCTEAGESYVSNVTASVISGSANSNPNSNYIEIKAASGYKLVSPITIDGVVENNADKTICVVYWEGDYSGSTFSKWENVTFPNRKTPCASASTNITFTGTVRTIRLYKQLYINNDGYQTSSGSGKTQGGNTNLDVTNISASAVEIGGGGDEPGDDPGDTPANYAVTHTLNNNVVAKSGDAGASAATEGTAYNAVFASSPVGLGYSLPSTIGVTIGGEAATAGTDYTWDASTGAFQVPAAKVTGAIAITIAGVAPEKTFRSDFSTFTQVGETNDYYSYLEQTSFVAYAKAGWMKYIGADDQISSAKLTIDPETDETTSGTNKTYAKVKQENAKSMEFYVTGITAVKFYFLNSSSKEDRTVYYKLNGGEAEDLVVCAKSSANAGTIDLDASANNTILVYAAGDLYLCAMKVTLPDASCAAGVPGNISKGTASGGTGIITLTAAGDIVSGDTWYWQSAADGTATNLGSGKTKDVNAAGTYYIRSYNTAGECWSAAKSVTVDEADLLTAPTATFSDGAYVVGASALDLSTLWSSNSSGTVTYALKVASEDATVSGTSFSATKAGSYVVTASQAATATYNAVEKEATITVTVNPLGSHTLTWTMKVGGSSSTSNLVNSVNSTSTYVTISNTPNIGSSSSVESATPKSDRTVKVLGDYIGTARGENSYIEFPFSIADGYTFTPTSASIKVANVDNTRSYDVVIMNASGSDSGETTFASTKTDGSVETISWNSISGLTLEGNCKMRVYAYLASGTTTHRFGTPLTITGTVAVKPTPAAPAITAPTTDQVAEYDLGSTITALEVTATGYPAPAYQWYKNATATATVDNEHKISGATNASYTPANDAASDFYYYCVATNTSGSATSHFFHVTVNSCTKPGTPANLAAESITYNSAALSWNEAANSDGYQISIIKKDDESVVLDWTACATNSYAATGLAQGTEYTFKVKAVGATGYCEYGLEAEADFTTTAPSVADLVTIADDWTFTPSATIAAGALAEGGKLFASGANDCDISEGKMRIKENRALAFKVNNGAKVKVTFTTNSNIEMKLGTAMTGDDSQVYGHSKTSPVTFNVTADGVVYLTATNQLYMSKMEIMYPHSVTYALNGGTGTIPTQESKYVGETFTAHDGVTGITAPATKEFDKWVDQDAADVAGGTTYTMPAKAVILTAQWKNETVKYSVTYDLGDYTSGVAPTETNKAAGDVITIKAAPARDSYNFLGWKCDVDAETYQANVPYTMTAAPTTFTAQWQEFFTITYKDGDDVLATEKVNKGSSPVGIEAPTKALKTFEGWTLVGETDLIDPTTLTETTILVAKWADFDGCAYMAIDREATAVLAANDDVALESASFGGEIKVKSIKTSGSIAYNANGLYFSGGNADKVSVNLTHQMQVGTKITVALRCPATGTRGLNLLNNNDGAVNSGTMLGWTSGVTDAEETFSYTVTAADGLDGEKVFVLQRNGTIYLQYVTVEDCAPQDFTVTYKDGETTLGTEDVFENAHPTANGIVTRKGGYIFQGWAETKVGDVVDLDDITITAAKTLYAKYTARDCSGIGTKYKFQLKTDLTSGNMFATAPVPATAMTTENYLSEIVGGELEVSNTNNNNNRVVISDQKAIGFSGGDGGKLTLYLNCPLQENDEIRFINYASSGNSITLSDGTNNTTLNGNGTETVQTFTIPEAWETTGSYVLTMVRGGGTAKLTYFEVYRRPELTDVTLNDLTIRTEQALAPQMTLTPVEGMVTSQEWEITSRTGATGATINSSTGVVTAGTETGTLTVQVTVNGTFVKTCTVTIINIYTSLVPVTGTTSWNWAGSATGEPKIDDVENRGTILANYINGANFEKLEGKAGEYAYRSSQYPCYQGTQLHFVTTVPGMLKINARSSGSGQRISVNSHEVTTSDLTSTVTEYSIVVPAGDVMITSNATNVRIYSMTFDTNLDPAEAEESTLGGYERPVTQGYYGTICLPNGGIMTGAMLFELAYFDETQQKIFFDEILNGVMVAGTPYIFLPKEGASQLGVYYTDAANAPAGDANGLHGSYTEEPLAADGSNYILYNNKYYLVNSGNVWVGENRAYIKLAEATPVTNPALAPKPKAGCRRIAMGAYSEQTATGIGNVQGDQVQNTKVMIDGQLFIICGDKMYDATGKQVK